MGKSKMGKVMSLLLVILLVFGVTVSGCAKPATTAPADQKEEKEFILIGRVNPTTGPLAGFGAGTPTVEEMAIEKVNADGGIYIKEYDKKIPLKLIAVDSESNPTKASEAATKLVLQDKVDILITAHTPDTTVPVSAVAERYQIPTISVDSPVDVWLTGGPYTWVFHTGFVVDSLNSVFMDMWDLVDTNKKVGFLYGSDPDGSYISEVIKPMAAERGYTCVDPGRFPQGTKDYTTIINQLKNEGVDIVTGNMITPDFATAWQQMHQQGFVPKVMTMGKAPLFPTDVASFGNDLGEGVTTEVWWSENHPYKSSLTGHSAMELAQWWTDTTQKQPSAVLGFKHAAIEITIDALKRAETLDKDKLREAIKATNLDTIIGHIEYNDENYCESMLVGGQWTKGETWDWELNIISKKQAPEVPLSEEPMFFVPGSE